MSAAVDQKVNQGIAETASVAVHQISRILIVHIAEISLNILIFLAIIFLAGSSFNYHTSVMLICSVYVGSLMHSTFKIIRNYDLILKITRHHHLNLKRFIFEQIYDNARLEAQEKFRRMGMLRRIFYKASAGPGADTIALRVANGAIALIWKRMLTRLFAILITVSLYILIFRMIVSPFLIQQATHFSLLQAFLWPFAFSIDYFFNTDFAIWVLSLG
jgi:hypothetical protein